MNKYSFIVVHEEGKKYPSIFVDLWITSCNHKFYDVARIYEYGSKNPGLEIDGILGIRAVKRILEIVESGLPDSCDWVE